MNDAPTEKLVCKHALILTNGGAARVRQWCFKMQLDNAFTFYAQTMPGLERITWREVQHTSPTARLVGYRRYRRQNGLVIFEYRDDPVRLLRLRTAEDVFYLADHVGALARGRAGLQALAQRIVRSRYFDVGLHIHRRVRLTTPAAHDGARCGVQRARHRGRRRGRTRFRVVSRMQGREHTYRRAAMRRAVEQGVLNRYNRKWRNVDDGADLEIWATLLEREFICGIRLSDRTMRHRPYKRAHSPASLRPSVAAAMVWLSRPQPADVFMDPMCGAGTILAERVLMGRYKRILGGDLDGNAVATGRTNVGPVAADMELRQWNAEALPLAAGSVDKVVVNLPFGQRHGSHQHNRSLYRQVFAELHRVLRPAGRLVALTGEQRLVDRILAAEPSLVRQEAWKLSLLGTPASIYVIDKRTTG